MTTTGMKVPFAVQMWGGVVATMAANDLTHNRTEPHNFVLGFNGEQYDGTVITERIDNGPAQLRVRVIASCGDEPINVTHADLWPLTQHLANVLDAGRLDRIREVNGGQLDHEGFVRYTMPITLLLG